MDDFSACSRSFLWLVCSFKSINKYSFYSLAAWWCKYLFDFSRFHAICKHFRRLATLRDPVSMYCPQKLGLGSSLRSHSAPRSIWAETLCKWQQLCINYKFASRLLKCRVFWCRLFVVFMVRSISFEDGLL